MIISSKGVLIKRLYLKNFKKFLKNSKYKNLAHNPTDIYLFKVNNGNTREMC